MEFLEKELRIQEEKSLIKHRLYTGNTNEQTKEDTYKRSHERKRDSYLADESRETTKSSFCGETGHSVGN